MSPNGFLSGGETCGHLEEEERNFLGSYLRKTRSVENVSCKILNARFARLPPADTIFIKLPFLLVTPFVVLKRNYCFFSRPSPKAGRELQTALDRIIKKKNNGGTLSEPEPVTGP